MDFFVIATDGEKQTIKANSRIVIALDCSGSTADNSILKHEIAFANRIAEKFTNVTRICFQSTAKIVEDFNSVCAGGGTDPVSFVDLLEKNDIKPDLMVLITDGQIQNTEEFKKKICFGHFAVPTIVSLVVPGSYLRANMHSFPQVDMSMIEAFLAKSSNVAVLVTMQEETFWLAGTGYFAAFPFPDDTLLSERMFSTLSKVDFDLIWSPNKVEQSETIFASVWNTFWTIFTGELPPHTEQPFSVEFEQLKHGVVRVSKEKLLVLDKLYDYCHQEFAHHIQDEDAQQKLAEVLQFISTRTILPQIDVTKMLAALRELQTQIDLWHNVDALRVLTRNLFQLHLKLQLQDSENVRQQIESLRQNYQKLEQQRDSRIISKSLQKTITSLYEILSQYNENKVAFDYSSNRAANARLIQETDLNKYAKCLTGQCPITLQKDNLCVFFQIPSCVYKNSNSSSLVETAVTDEQRRDVTLYFTRNQMIDNSALCGTAMLDCITPGVFGIEFAKQQQIAVNPLTNLPILGFLPLSFDVNVLILHLSKMLTGGREMPFLLQAYVSMVAQHSAKNKWIQPQLVTHARFILSELLVRCRFINETRIAALMTSGKSYEEAEKEANEFETSLEDSIQYQLKNPECLRLLSHGQVMALVDIATQLMPDFSFNAAQACAVANFCDAVRSVRQRYVKMAQEKRPQDIMIECFYSDGTLRNNLYGHVAWFFASFRNNAHELRQLRFQALIDRLLQDETFGAYFTSVISAKPAPSTLPVLVPTIIEPDTNDVHFDITKSAAMYARLLQHDHDKEICCAYCGAEFLQDTQSLPQTTLASCHVKNAQGSHFIEFTRILLHKPELFQGNNKTEIEQKIMRYLQKRCGAKTMAIYTQRTRKEIRAMMDAYQIK